MTTRNVSKQLDVRTYYLVSLVGGVVVGVSRGSGGRYASSRDSLAHVLADSSSSSPLFACHFACLPFIPHGRHAHLARIDSRRRHLWCPARRSTPTLERVSVYKHLPPLRDVARRLPFIHYRAVSSRSSIHSGNHLPALSATLHTLYRSPWRNKTPLRALPRLPFAGLDSGTTFCAGCTLFRLPDHGW